MIAGNLDELQEVPFIIKEVCDRPLFAKLVYNKDTDDPANQSLPMGITNYDLLTYKNVFPYLKIIDVSEEGQNIYVNIYFGSSVALREHADNYKSNMLYVDVFVHQDLWKIKTGIRTYGILAEIDKALNNKDIDFVTERFHFFDMKALGAPNPKYAGFGLRYSKIDIGLKCDE